MPRRLVLPLVVALLSLSACRRDPNLQPPSPPPSPTVAASTFGISGDTAVAVMQARSVDATIFLSDSGAGPPQNLSISGLPPGVTAVFTRTISTPPDQTILRLTAGPILNGGPSSAAPAGASSTATVLARLAGGAEKTHRIKVTVLENPSCTEVRVGTYTKSGCSGGWPVYVTVDPTSPATRIRINNFPSDGRSTYAELDCFGSTLAIPRQNAGLTNFFWATGTFSRDTMMGTGIFDYGGAGINTDTCSFRLVRQ